MAHSSRARINSAHGADAALDALKRSLSSRGDRPGLRGDTFHTDFADVWTTTPTDAAAPRTSTPPAPCTGPSTADP
jgi:hypothetical protein